MNSDHLRGRAALGIGYLSVLSFFEKGVRIVRVAILARLLAPVDFGIVALSTVLSSGLLTITSFGAERYLIQKEDVSDEFAQNVWVFNAIRGIFVCSFVLLMASLYSRIVGEPRAQDVLFIISLSPLFDGLVNPGKYLAEREMKFKRIAVFEGLTLSIQTFVMISLAILLRDVRALAWGMVATSVLRCALSFVFFPRPRVRRFRLHFFGEIFSVGKHFMIISVGTLVTTQGDNLIIGALAGSAVLGIYVLAYRLCEFPIEILDKTANRLLFPFFSRIQSEQTRLTQALVRAFGAQLALLLPIITLMLVLARPIILTFYGDKWTDAVLILQILTLVALMRGITHLISPYLFGTGHFPFASKVKAIEAVLFVAAVYAGTSRWGVIGGALGAGLSYTGSAAILVWFVSRHSHISPLRLLGRLNKPLACSLPSALAVLLLSSLWSPAPAFQLLMLTLLFVSIYLSLSAVVQKDVIRMLWKAWGDLRASRRDERALKMTSV